MTDSTNGKTRSRGVRISAAGVVALALFCLLGAALPGCGETPYGTGAQRFRLPWPDASGAYALRTVELRTFDSPESLAGSRAKILISPYVVGSDLSSGGSVGRFFRDADGVLHPEDVLTRQGATAYAHMERLYDLDADAGVASVLRWPAKIGLNTVVRDGNGDVRNNAFYDSGFDAILMVPPTSGLEIPYNAGIWGHEHFHSIFAALVHKVLGVEGRTSMDPDEWARLSLAGSRGAEFGATSPPPPPPRAGVTAAQALVDETNEFALRGVNEGMADFWGWLYSGDDQFVGRSLPGENARRRMDRDPSQLISTDDWRAACDNVRKNEKDLRVRREGHLFNAYLLGTQYALFMRRAALQLATGAMSVADAKRAAARALVRALPRFAESIKAPWRSHSPFDVRAAAAAFAQATGAASAQSLLNCVTGAADGGDATCAPALRRAPASAPKAGEL